MLETKKKIGRVMLITAAICLLFSLSCTASYAIGCRLCEILHTTYVIVGLLFITSLAVFIITANIYSKSSKKTKKKKYAKAGLIISGIITALLMLLIIILAIIPYLTREFAAVNLPDPIGILRGCEDKCTVD